MIKLGDNWEERLRALPDSWNDDVPSYRITSEAIGTLKAFGVAPMPDGGIQLEIHRDGRDIKIEIASSGKLGAIIVEVNTP
jgi:hypothetical protein